MFVQDDFKLRPNLTINLGLRWSYFGSLYSTENNLDTVQFGAGPNPLTNLNIRVGGHFMTPRSLTSDRKSGSHGRRVTSTTSWYSAEALEFPIIRTRSRLRRTPTSTHQARSTLSSTARTPFQSNMFRHGHRLRNCDEHQLDLRIRAQPQRDFDTEQQQPSGTGTDQRHGVPSKSEVDRDLPLFVRHAVPVTL